MSEDFPAVRRQALDGVPLFPEYTGAAPAGKAYKCGASQAAAVWETFEGGESRWRAWHDQERMCFEVDGAVGSDLAAENMVVELEPRRLWPVQKFSVAGDGKAFHHSMRVAQDTRWAAAAEADGGAWTATFSIPFVCFEGFHEASRPMRLNVVHNEAAWIKKTPWESRLRFGEDNPADLGWLFFV